MIDKRILRTGVLKKKKKEPYQCSNNEFNFHFTVSPSLFFLIFLPNSPDASETLFAIFVQLTNCRGEKKKKKWKKIVTSIYRIRNHGVPIHSQYSCLCKIRQQIFKWPVHNSVPGKELAFDRIVFFLPRFRGSIRQTFSPIKPIETFKHDKSRSISGAKSLWSPRPWQKKKKRKKKKDIANKCNSRGTLCNLKRLKKESKKKKNFNEYL